MNSELETAVTAAPSETAVRSLLAQAGLARDFRLESLTGGANNRVYRVHTSSGSTLLKWYFAHPNDPRDRLRAEYEFTKLAWENGIDYVPRPLACDAANRLGLFEFIEGRRPTPADVTSKLVRDAALFVFMLNECRNSPEARSLLAAAEACFSLADHVACIQGRVDRLKTLSCDDEVDRAAMQFVNEQLEPASRAMFEAARDQAQIERLPWDEPLPYPERCLSPSDFGFHNAILSDEGGVRFIDFEYAGWDDPAKMLCDFFHQVQLPVSRDYFDFMAESTSRVSRQPETVIARANCLMDLYGIKWCCIVLNEFLPTSAARRAFSGINATLEERKTWQLQKARDMLKQLQERRST